MIKNKKVPPSLLGIAGRAGSGKDLVGKIIQYLCLEKKLKIIEPFEKSPQELLEKYGDWKIKRFAGVLKQITCLLLGCSMEELEDRDFKETELGEEWWYYKHNVTHKIISIEEFKRINNLNRNLLDSHYILIKLTPRLLLQLLGTECGRQIIHPNIWLLATFASYNEQSKWIITDVRFPNELEAIKKRNGITIKVERDSFLRTGLVIEKDLHESETALDNSEFDYVIENKGTISELAEKVREILIKEGLL